MQQPTVYRLFQACFSPVFCLTDILLATETFQGPQLVQLLQCALLTTDLDSVGKLVENQACALGPPCPTGLGYKFRPCSQIMCHPSRYGALEAAVAATHDGWQDCQSCTTARYELCTGAWCSCLANRSTAQKVAQILVFLVIWFKSLAQA